MSSPAAADPIADGTHDEGQDGDHQAVEITDPQLLDSAGVQVGRKLGQRQKQDIEVQRHQDGGQREQSKTEPCLARRRERGGHQGLLS